MAKRKDYPLYLPLKALVRLFFPKMELVGREMLPEEPVLVVANHCQMYGPVACELYYPEPRFTWCAGQMMHRKEVAAYAYEDFWSQKPRYSRWFYRLLSHLIAPLSVLIFNNADTVPVYRDARIVRTLRQTLQRLQEGASVVVFPEHDAPHNHVLSEFQEKFIDVARLYYSKTGRALTFVPMYIAPARKKMVLGQPVIFRPEEPIGPERRRICEHLMAEITSLAEALPEHRVVPYRNIPKKDYPSSRTQEKPYEKTGS